MLNPAEVLDVDGLRDRLDGDLHAPGDAGWDEARTALEPGGRPAPRSGRGAARRGRREAPRARGARRRLADLGAGHRPQRCRLRRPRAHAADLDEPDARPWRSIPRRGSPGSRRARSGPTSQRRRPSTVSPASRARPTTSAIVGYSARRRRQLPRSKARIGGGAHPRGRDRHRRRGAATRRCRERAGSVLGAARRRRQLRGRHRDRDRAAPIERLYAGALFFPLERALEVLQAWRRLDGRRSRGDDLGRQDACTSRRCPRSRSQCAETRSP